MRVSSRGRPSGDSTPQAAGEDLPRGRQGAPPPATACVPIVAATATPNRHPFDPDERENVPHRLRRQERHGTSATTMTTCRIRNQPRRIVGEREAGGEQMGGDEHRMRNAIAATTPTETVPSSTVATMNGTSSQR